MTYVTMDNNGPLRFCMTPRFGMTSWGYCKIFINIILLALMVELMVDIFDGPFMYDIFQIAIAASIMALVITDIVFQSKLIHGLRKNKVEHLIAYCKYTKILWVLMTLSSVLYIFNNVTDIMGPIFWPYTRSNRVLTVMCTFLFGTLLQSVMMWLVIKEIKKLIGEVDEVSSNSGSIRIFNFGFTIKIETSSSEKAKGEDKNTTHPEDTSETVKLTA